MTHPSEGRKLTDNEIYSISNAVKEAGIQQIHPDKMEAFADSMVEKLKEEPPLHSRVKRLQRRVGGLVIL